ncbi:MAG TPA: hypothetical protein VHV51_20140 [Polyangiaceae bacterium]|nr:hypothetical protein [Polyangiaceae bacterium]
MAGLAVGLLVPRQLRAQALPPVTVDREAGAEDCPDTAALTARVQALLGHGTPSSEATAYRVTFSHSPGEFSAAIRSGTDGATVRYLNAREPSCGALAHATAIALAVLFDADFADDANGADGSANGADGERAAPESAEPPAPPLTPPPTKIVPRPPEDETDAGETASKHAGERVDPWFALGAAGLAFALRPVVPALLADFGIEASHFRGSVGVIWVPPETIRLAPGSAEENLIGGNFRGCYAFARRAVWRWDLCTGAVIGAASAEARGFSTNERHTELFLAFPLELGLSARAHSFGWQLGLSGLVLAPPNEFNVAGVGLTYHAPPIAGMLALRVFFQPLR